MGMGNRNASALPRSDPLAKRHPRAARSASRVGCRSHSRVVAQAVSVAGWRARPSRAQRHALKGFLFRAKSPCRGVVATARDLIGLGLVLGGHVEHALLALWRAGDLGELPIVDGELAEEARRRWLRRQSA